MAMKAQVSIAGTVHKQLRIGMLSMIDMLSKNVNFENTTAILC
jgi:hypothetical protein